MITVVQRGEPAGLASNEIVLGARRSARHRLLLFQLRPKSLARPENRPQNDHRRQSFMAQSECPVTRRTSHSCCGNFFPIIPKPDWNDKLK